jgi:hypothetical protein
MIHRTTIRAEEQDLKALRADARSRGLSFARYMQEVVAEKVADLRERKRPRIGVVRSRGLGVAQESVEREDEPAKGRG